MPRDFRMVSGDSATLSMTARDLSDAVVDLTGGTLRWELHAKGCGDADVSKATGGSGITVTDADDGTFTVTLDPGDTTDLRGEYLHEAQFTSAGGAVTTVVRGRLTIIDDIVE